MAICSEKSQIRQYLGLFTADPYANEDQKSAVKQTKYYRTFGLLTTPVHGKVKCFLQKTFLHHKKVTP